MKKTLLAASVIAFTAFGAYAQDSMTPPPVSSSTAVTITGPAGVNVTTTGVNTPTTQVTAPVDMAPGVTTPVTVTTPNVTVITTPTNPGNDSSSK